ncbi:MAG: methyltransferase domain-containing protein [Ardenticatenaceae bacterium]|nr:methyltransferase domain-containing protein [Ardenticatenaceae bacterium]
MYDKISRWYDLLEGNWETTARVAGLRKLDAREGERVLEIGVGTGHNIVALAHAVGESGKVYGFDLSPGMLEATRARLRERGLVARVALEEGDAVRLPFEEGAFDAVFMSFTLELFDTPEIPEVVGECRRVLRVGGRICVVSISKAGGSSPMRELFEWGHHTFPAFLDCRPIFVQRALEEAGFQIVDATQISLWGLPVEIILARKPG